MKAIKLRGTVQSDHSLHLQLPEDIKAGPAEVIVLVENESVQLRSEREGLAQFFADRPIDPRHTRTKEDIDSSLQKERNSWD